MFRSKNVLIVVIQMVSTLFLQEGWAGSCFSRSARESREQMAQYATIRNRINEIPLFLVTTDWSDTSVEMASDIIESSRRVFQRAAFLNFVGSEIFALKQHVAVLEFMLNLRNFEREENTEGRPLVSSDYLSVTKRDDLPLRDRDSSCGICLEKLVDVLGTGVELASLRCGNSHIFCRNCISEWFTRRAICPLCLKEIQEGMKDIQEGATE